MSFRLAISSFLTAFLALGTIGACSDETATGPTPGTDASSSSDTSTPDKDASSPVDGSSGQDSGQDSSNANCPGEIKTGNGETCIGYGTGTTCEPSCGQPY